MGCLLSGKQDLHNSENKEFGVWLFTQAFCPLERNAEVHQISGFMFGLRLSLFI
jgi:hypothetical protein